ncbi:hypothetical protein [Actinomadura harenae]|uniref:hypothetical protein n=1 Tax=Actinomadura harenae TaxID=2483351 RepID=UPI00131518BA|nr:hypothetical protein [Actinomadura harenae]
MTTLDADDTGLTAVLAETARLLREDALLCEAIADLTGEEAGPFPRWTGTVTRRAHTDP